MNDTLTAFGIIGFAACAAALFVLGTRNKHHETCQSETTDQMKLTTDQKELAHKSMFFTMLEQQGISKHTVRFNKFLDKLSEVESSNDPNAVGQSGERGQYQMSGGAWEDVSAFISHRGVEPKRFDEAFDPYVARAYAGLYLYILWHRFTEDFGYDCSAEQLWCMWNCGYYGASTFGFKVEDSPTMTRKKAVLFKGIEI